MSETQRRGVPASLIATDADLCLATWHQTVIYVCRRVASVEHVKRLSAACQSLLETSRGPVTCLAVVERASPPPVDLVRREMAIWSRDVVPKLATAVIVPEGSGFRSSLVQGVVVFLTTIVPHQVPFKFAASVAGAAELLSRYLPTTSGGATELTAEIARIRSL